MRSPANLHRWGGYQGGRLEGIEKIFDLRVAIPPGEDRVHNFRKERLQFKVMFKPLGVLGYAPILLVPEEIVQALRLPLDTIQAVAPK